MVGRNRALLLFLVRARFRRASLGGGTLRGNAADTLRRDLGWDVVRVRVRLGLVGSGKGAVVA